MREKNTPANAVSRYVADLPDGTVFATRDLLHLARRSSLDSVLCRLTQNGQLHRLAQGIYLKNGDPNNIPLEEIAKVKAEAFGRQIKSDLGRIESNDATNIYLTNGRTTTFTVRGKRIKLLERSPSSLLRAEDLP